MAPKTTDTEFTTNLKMLVQLKATMQEAHTDYLRSQRNYQEYASNLATDITQARDGDTEPIAWVIDDWCVVLRRTKTGLGNEPFYIVPIAHNTVIAESLG